MRVTYRDCNVAKRFRAVGAEKLARLVAVLTITVLLTTTLLSSSASAANSLPATSKTASGKGGTLSVAYASSSFGSLDTIALSLGGALPANWIGNQIYDGLTRYDLNQAKSSPTAVPDLATSWTYTSTSKSSTYVFNLRKGVTFQDGTPWNADAAIFNYRRWTDPSFKYYDSVLAGATAEYVTQFISSMTETGPYQITVTTPTPNAFLPQEAALIYFASPTAVEKEGNANFAQHPVGTGPFKFASVVAGQSLNMVANKHYWQGAPKLSQLVLKPIADSTAQALALRSGQVNAVPGIEPDDVASLKSAGYQVTGNTFGQVTPLIFNTQVAPFNNVEVRQAIGFAINRPPIANSLLDGTAAPAYQIATPGAPASLPKNNYYSYNVKKAKSLLAKAGYPNGFKFTVAVESFGDGDAEPGPLANVVAKDLSAVGIQMTVEIIDETTLQASLFKQLVFPPGTSATIESISFSQNANWYKFFGTTGPQNVAKYSNQSVDALLAQAQTTPNQTKQSALLAQATVLITKDGAWIPIITDEQPYALSSDVRNFIQPKSFYVNVNKVWVANG